MSKTLAELRQSSQVGLPERTPTLCLAGKLVSEVYNLMEQREEAKEAASAQREGDASAVPPRRAAESSPIPEISDRLRELHAEMAEHTGTLTLQGVISEEWRKWVDAHPAREGNKRDQQVAFGYCDADALLDNLGQFAKAWNGEPLGPGDWEFIASTAAPGDLKELTQIVVAMHEVGVDIPKLQASLLETVGDATS